MGQIVLIIIIALSFSVVVAVMYFGTRPDVDAGHDEEGHIASKAVAYWTARADKLDARRLSTAAAGAAAGGAGAASGGDEDAEKERKRQEALARKAARAAKSTGSE